MLRPRQSVHKKERPRPGPRVRVAGHSPAGPPLAPQGANPRSSVAAYPPPSSSPARSTTLRPWAGRSIWS